MLTEMSKVYIIGLKSHFMEALQDVHSFGKVHINDLSDEIESGDLPIEQMQLEGSLAEQHEQLKTLNSQAQTLIMNFYGSPDVLRHVCDGMCYSHLTNDEVIRKAADFYTSIKPMAIDRAAEIGALEQEQAELLQYEPLLTKLEPSVKDLVGSQELYSTALIIESRYRDAVNELRNQLLRITDDEATTLVSNLNDEMLALIIVAPLDKAGKIHQFISEKQVNQIKLPHTFSERPFSEALFAMHERIAQLPDLLDAARFELAQYAEKHRDELCVLSNEVADRLEELDQIAHLGETDYTFVCSGYVPTRAVGELSDLFAQKYGSSVVVEKVDIAPEEYPHVPVALENKKRFRPFQAALGIWGQPVYGTIDPSWILAISFPFIFGMIVGDAGYGLLLLALCLFFKWKYPHNNAVQAFTGVLAPAGLMSIVFGVFYFEFFGDLAHVYIPELNKIHPIVLAPGFTVPFIRTASDLQTTFLLMAVGFGVIEVVVGLIFGIINGHRMGERKHIIEKSGILAILFAGLGIAALKFLPSLTAAMSVQSAAVINYLVYFVLAIGFIITLWGGGIMGAIETVESVAHIASYIRIMAVGLVGALLADAANELAFVTMPNAGGIIIALMLHVLNFAIICFSPSIHALRLTFLEFFGKFWEAGRVAYKPFVRIGKDE